jgi:hypothetical protein
MKVTNEMVEAAYGIVGLPERCILDALEAALADVPDYEARWVEASSRALVAEAKIAKVRERAEDIGLNDDDLSYLLGEDK